MLTRLLTETASLTRLTAGAPDGEGNPTWTTSSLEVSCRVAQQSTDDTSGDGDRRSTRLVMYLHPGAELDGNDLVVKDGRTFEVEGAPYLASTPRGAHHWEVTLREVAP